MSQASQTSHSPESHISNAYESVESEKKLEISDFNDFAILDGISASEKEQLTTLSQKKLETDENYSSPEKLSQKIPEISKISEFSQAPAEEKKEELNALALGGVIALTELVENFSKEEREKFLETAKINPAGATGWEHLTQKETQALAVISDVLSQTGLSETSAGKVIQENWGSLVESVQNAYLTVEADPYLFQEVPSIIPLSPPQHNTDDYDYTRTGVGIAGALGGAVLGGEIGGGGIPSLFTSLGGSVVGSIGAKTAYDMMDGKSFSKSVSSGISSTVKSGKSLLSTGNKEVKKIFSQLNTPAEKIAAGVLGLGVLWGGYKLISSFFSSDESSENSGDKKSGFNWKTAGVLGIIGLAGIFGFKNFDFLKNLLPEGGIQGAIEDAKNTVVEGAKDLVKDGEEKLEKVDQKITDFWEGPENSETGKREGGKREEWAKMLEEKGYTDFSKRIREISTTELEISGVVGGGLALVIFRKLFLGGAVKLFLGGKKRMILMLGAAWLIGKNIEGIKKIEILKNFDVLADLEKKKNEILKIYAYHGITGGKILDTISEKFSPENAVKYIDDMFADTSGEKGFFAEQGSDIAKGGLAIVGSLIALNAVGGFARLLFSKKGIMASIIAFLYTTGLDITKMRSFYNATIEAFGKPLQEQFSKVSTPILQKVLPEYEFLQKTMRALGMSVYDYSLSPEKADITHKNLEKFQKKYENSSDSDEVRFAEKAEEIIKDLTSQKEKNSENSVILQTRDFTILCLRAKRIGLEVSSSASGGTFSLEIDGEKFSGFPFDPLLTDNFPRTDEQIRITRNTILKTGLKTLLVDIDTHGTPALQKKYEFTSEDVSDVSTTIQSLLKKLESENSSLAEEDIEELRKSLAGMKATLSSNNQGELMVHFSSDNTFLSQDTFIGFNPHLSNEDFLENEGFLNLNIAEATIKGYSEFFAESTKGILSLLDVTGSGENMKDLIEIVHSDPELLGGPHLWAKVCIAIAEDAKSGERGVGMTILDGTIIITAGAVGIPIEMGKEAYGIMMDILGNEFSLDKTLVENPLGTVLSVGVMAKGLEKGFHYIGARKLGKFAGVIRWGSLTVPKHMVMLPYTTGKYAWKGFKGVAGISSEFFGRIPLLSPEVMWKNTQSRIIGASDWGVSQYRGRLRNPFVYGFSKDIRFKIISELREAQREYRKMEVAMKRGGAEITKSELKIRDRWFAKYDALKNHYNDLGRQDLLKGSAYEGKSFEDLMRKKEIISIRDAKLLPREKSALLRNASKIITKPVKIVSSASEKIGEVVSKKIHQNNNPEYKKVEKQVSKIAKTLKLSPEKHAQLLEKGGKLLKTVGVAGTLYALYIIGEAQNPYSAITKDAAAIGLLKAGFSMGGKVGGVWGKAIGTIVAGVAIVIWGDEASAIINDAVEKFEKEIIDKNGESIRYLDAGKRLQGISLGSYLSRIMDATVGEIWKGKNAYDYFSDTDSIYEFSGMRTYLHRDFSDIQSWNNDLESQISEKNKTIQEAKSYLSRISPEKNNQITSEYGKLPSPQKVKTHLETLHKDDHLYIEKQYFLQMKQAEYERESLKSQIIPDDGGEWIKMQNNQFITEYEVLQRLKDSQQDNTVEYFRKLQDFVVHYNTLKNMNFLEKSFELMKKDKNQKEFVSKIPEFYQSLKTLEYLKNIPDEISDILTSIKK